MKMKVTARSVSAVVAVTAIFIVGCASAQRIRNSVAAATAVISDVNGKPVGTAELWQEPSGLVNVEIAGLTLPPGTHGIHFHDVGKCEGGTTAFSTAGPHFNPLAKKHGLSNPLGPHAGDAPNLLVPPSGLAHVAFTTDRVTLTPGTISVFDANGTALVVHAAADDQTTDPSGNSGARIACGVITAVR
jgi:Cu-Zn family superoxide dismutase